MTTEQIKAALQTMIAITEAIREAGEIPSGHLYAVLSGHMSLGTYESMIRELKATGLVVEQGYLLRWVGPSA